MNFKKCGREIVYLKKTALRAGFFIKRKFRIAVSSIAFGVDLRLEDGMLFWTDGFRMKFLVFFFDFFQFYHIFR